MREPMPAPIDWRSVYVQPPVVDLVLPSGMVCPLDDVVLVPHGTGLCCPTCRAAWDARGRDGWWLPVRGNDVELSVFGGMTLPDMLAIENAAQLDGLLTAQTRVTCPDCLTWATQGHLDDRHGGVPAGGCGDAWCEGVCGNCRPVVEADRCPVCDLVAPCPVHGQVVDGRLVDAVDQVDAVDRAARLRRVDRLLAWTIGAGAVGGFGYALGRLTHATRVWHVLPSWVWWTAFGAVASVEAVWALVLAVQYLREQRRYAGNRVLNADELRSDGGVSDGR